MSGVSPYPGPLHVMAPSGAHQGLPQRKVLDGAGGAGPASGLPARSPEPHAFDQILRVRDHQDSQPCTLRAEKLERRRGTDQGHAIVRGSAGRAVEVPALDAGAGPGFNQAPVSTLILSLSSIAQAALVQVHHRDTAHSMTWKLSISWSRKVRSSPVIGSRPIRTSSRPSVVTRSATTIYSVPRRESATRRPLRAACSS